MPSRFTIPLNAIHAIETVVRRGSLAAAAEELGVTPGAVSQHLKRAEERLGTDLFERTPQGLVPTEALRAQMPRLEEGFSHLAEAVASLKPDEGQGLTITAGSMFAALWLVPRLGRFAAHSPDVELRLVATPKLLDLSRHDIDCAIRFGVGAWPGLTANLLGNLRYRPYCAPSLAARLRSPADLLQVPIIRDETSMLSWRDWFAAAGLAEPLAMPGPAFTDPVLAVNAAFAGQGAVLAMDMLTGDALAEGRLVQPFPIAAETRFGYWFAVAEGRRLRRPVRQFRDWLQAEMTACTPSDDALRAMRSSGERAGTLPG